MGSMESKMDKVKIVWCILIWVVVWCINNSCAADAQQLPEMPQHYISIRHDNDFLNLAGKGQMNITRQVSSLNMVLQTVSVKTCCILFYGCPVTYHPKPVQCIV